MADETALKAAIRASIQNYCAAHHDFSFQPNKPVIRLHEPTFGADEIWAALDCMLTTQVTLGPKVRQFEREFASAYRYHDTLMCNSGSSANLLAIAALTTPRVADGLRAGDEVIVPALSWSTTVWPLIQQNLIPVVVDIDPVTLNLDPMAVEKAIGPKTRGIMPVHVYGNPCDMSALLDICHRHNLILIEDCCEALGAFYDGKAVGSFGRVGTYSFYFSHHMTTLEGGLCVTNDASLVDPMRMLRAHGWVRETVDPEIYYAQHPEIDRRFLFMDVGYNLRPTELQGAMGTVQLPKLPGWVEHRRVNAEWWLDRFQRWGNVMTMQQETPNARSSWFGICLTLNDDAGFSRADICKFMNERGIETRPIIAGNIAAQPALKLYPHRVAGDLPNATAVMHRGFAFANHQEVNDTARQYIADALEDFMAGRAG